MKVSGLIKNIGAHSLYIENYTEEIKSHRFAAPTNDDNCTFWVNHFYINYMTM